jgi:hypothetical protein
MSIILDTVFSSSHHTVSEVGSVSVIRYLSLWALKEGLSRENFLLKIFNRGKYNIFNENYERNCKETEQNFPQVGL